MLDQPKKSICGTWTLKGDAAALVLRKQDELKTKSPNGCFSKQKTIQLLLCELYEMKEKEKAKAA